MAALYEITGDILNIYALLDSLVDDNGEPREPTEAELETMKQWMAENIDDFKKKFDNCCRLIKNLRLAADNAEAAKKNFKAEGTRLTRRHKALENRARSVQELLRWNMERIALDKFKSDCFSANIQNIGGKVVSVASTVDTAEIPELYLKPREVDTAAILQDLKDGILEERDGIEKRTKVFVKGGGILPFIHVTQPSALVIR